MRIDIEEILALKKRLREINALDLKSIEFFENDQKIEIKPKNIEDFRFTGLSNCDFIDTEFYKTGFNNEN